MKKRKIVIVGAGPAGYNAAKAAIGENAEVSLYGSEAYLPYWRPQLPKIVVSGAGPETIAIANAEWYKDNGISFYPNKTMVSIDQEEKRVVWADGERTAYDKLILAIGASSFVPDIGYDGNVLSLRSYDDALAIRQCVLAKGKAVVIGGGLLGLELAMEITKLGAEVAVFERAPWLMPRQLDQAGGNFLQRKLTEQGLLIKTAINAGDHLEELEGACVIMAAGVRSNIAVAKDAGLEIGRAIVVNNKMETSSEDIYACGDVAEFNGRAWGLIPVANSQGMIAGKCACENQGEYQEILPSPMLKVASLNITSVGDIAEDAEAQWYRHEDDDTYRAFKVRDGKLLAAIIFNDMKLSMKAKKFIDQKNNLIGQLSDQSIIQQVESVG